MSYEPGRERHTITLCENCSRVSYGLVLHWSKDEYWCESCFDDEAIAEERKKDAEDANNQ